MGDGASSSEIEDPAVAKQPSGRRRLTAIPVIGLLFVPTSRTNVTAEPLSCLMRGLAIVGVL